MGEGGGKVSSPRERERGTGKQDDEEIELSKLVEKVNEALGTDFDEADRLFLQQLKDDTLNDDHLRQSARVNSQDNFALEFDSALTEMFIDRMDQNQELFQKFMDNSEVQEVITEHLRKAVYQESQAAEG